MDALTLTVPAGKPIVRLVVKPGNRATLDFLSPDDLRAEWESGDTAPTVILETLTAHGWFVNADATEGREVYVVAGE